MMDQVIVSTGRMTSEVYAEVRHPNYTAPESNDTGRRREQSGEASGRSQQRISYSPENPRRHRYHPLIPDEEDRS
jgi:hypothetical protein